MTPPILPYYVQRAYAGFREHLAAARNTLDTARREVAQLGGWNAFRNGEWLPRLTRRAFQRYYEETHRSSLARIHASHDTGVLTDRVIWRSAKDAAVLGAVVGAVVSLDEAIAIATGGEAGVGLPANLAIAFLGIAGEAVVLARIQLQLVAGLAKVYAVSLGPDAPEEISAILASALGVSLLETRRQAVKGVRSRLGKAVCGSVGNEILSRIPRLGQRVGITLFERNVMKYGAPLASLVIGSSWNFVTTRAVGRVAQQQLRAIADRSERVPD